MADAYAYEPTLRDELAALLLKNAPRHGMRERMVRNIIGSGGAGDTGGALPLIDFTPAGIPLAAQEAGRAIGLGAKNKNALETAGGLTAAALTMLPGGKAAAKGVKAAEKKLAAKAAEKVAAPAISKTGVGVGRDLAADVFYEAAQKKDASRLPFNVWRAQNEDKLGDLFDYSVLRNTPDVPQEQMFRVVPPRGPSARIISALENPEVERGINAAVEKGAKLGGLEWYNTEPMRESMIEAVGRADAPKRYATLMDMVSATSPRSKVTDNVRTASYYNYLLNNNLPLPEKPATGYGSVAQNLHRQNVANLLERGGWDVTQNPKPASFSSNLQGNQQNVTIDTHNFRLPGILSRDPRFLATSIKTAAGKDAEVLRPQAWHKSGELSIEDAVNRPVYWESKPNANEYGYYEKWQQDQARKLGMTPAQYQASMWVGAGDETGLGSALEPFLKTFEARVKYTADRLGVDPKTVLKGVMSGKTPLLAKGGRVNKLAVKKKPSAS